MRGCSIAATCVLSSGCTEDTVDASETLGSAEGLDDEAGEDSGSSCANSEWIEDDPRLLESSQVSISQELAIVRGCELGDQVRIERSGAEQYALFTVAEVREVGSAQDPAQIGMNADARLRLGMNLDEPEVCAHLVTKIAPMAPDFIERSHLGSAQIAILAPHGGKIEEFTDEQADLLAERLAAHDPSTWICEGYHAGGGAFRIWHVPSAEISVNSFPMLDSLDDVDYEWTVAFHGFSPAGECAQAIADPLMDIVDPAKLVIVGGRADAALLVDIRDAIADALGDDFQVIVASSGPCAGQNLDNIVNRLSTMAHSVQIESSTLARANGNFERVADAVADVLAPHLGDP